MNSEIDFSHIYKILKMSENRSDALILTPLNSFDITKQFSEEDPQILLMRIREML